MTDTEKLELINSMEVVDFSASGGEMEYVLVEDNKVNREILYKIGMTDEKIKEECNVEEDGGLDLISIGFKYANYFWQGKGFYNK